jgi:hypothetical protein
LDFAGHADGSIRGPPIWRTPAQLLSHLECGKLKQSDLDAAAKNVLRMAIRVAQSGIPSDGIEETVDTEDSRTLLRRLAASAVCLLKNDLGVLPVHLKQGQKIAVIGNSAASCNTSGGGAASVPRETFICSPLVAITEAANEVGALVDWAPGVIADKYTPDASLLLSPPGFQKKADGQVATLEFWRQQPHPNWTTTDGGLEVDVSPDYSMISPSAKCFIHDGVPESIVNNADYVRVSSKQQSVPTVRRADDTDSLQRTSNPR